MLTHFCPVATTRSLPGVCQQAHFAKYKVECHRVQASTAQWCWKHMLSSRQRPAHASVLMAARNSASQASQQALRSDAPGPSCFWRTFPCMGCTTLTCTTSIARPPSSPRRCAPPADHASARAHPKHRILTHACCSKQHATAATQPPASATCPHAAGGQTSAQTKVTC